MALVACDRGILSSRAARLARIVGLYNPSRLLLNRSEAAAQSVRRLRATDGLR
jgi:hypothetical protein